MKGNGDEKFAQGCCWGRGRLPVARSVSENFPTGGDRAGVGGSHRLDHDVGGVHAKDVTKSLQVR